MPIGLIQDGNYALQTAWIGIFQFVNFIQPLS